MDGNEYFEENLINWSKASTTIRMNIDFLSKFTYKFIHIASLPLRKVGDNRLLLLHDKGASEDEVITYGRKYGLLNEKEAKRSIQFAKDPLWRSYGFNYSLGYELISKLLSSTENKDQIFTRLLQESLTPAQVRRMVSQ